MPYADTDFFVALLKKGDWLAGKAKEALNKYRGEIWTSHWTIVEILLLAEEFGLDPEKVVIDVKELARVDGYSDAILLAAHLMKENGFRTFDALHAASCLNDKIISSDPIFDRLGMDRIKLNDQDFTVVE